MKYTIDWDSADATTLAVMLMWTTKVPQTYADPLSLRPAAHHKPDDIVLRAEILDGDGGPELYTLERAKWEESINYFMYHHGWLAGLDGKALRAALDNYDLLSAIVAIIFNGVRLDPPTTDLGVTLDELQAPEGGE